MKTKPIYQTKAFELSGLRGISDKTMEIHFKLYEGYVKEANLLTEKVADFLEAGEVKLEKLDAYAEIMKRFKYERNGVKLHEFYFENLKKHGGGEPKQNSQFLKKIHDSFGSYEAWKKAFIKTGQVRGVGWALCCENPESGKLSNHWIMLHDLESLKENTPVLVLDVWEHAYFLDYKPSERKGYIDSFFHNVDWSVVESRIRPQPYKVDTLEFTL